MLLPKAAGATGSRAQTDPAYRRALLTVVVLNLGFGSPSCSAGSSPIAKR
jgi:hypothetical protein